MNQKINDARFAKMSQRYEAGLADRIDAYHAEERNRVTTRHITIHYNCIGAILLAGQHKGRMSK